MISKRLQDIQSLRKETGLSLNDCKIALEYSDGDVEGALEWLKKLGEESAENKYARETPHGLIYSYVHLDKIGVLVEVHCETDFAARSEPFKEFAELVALQVASNTFTALKPEMYAGPACTCMGPILPENCLLGSPAITDPSKTIDDLRKELVAKLGENVVITRYSRLELGEYPMNETGACYNNPLGDEIMFTESELDK